MSQTRSTEALELSSEQYQPVDRPGDTLAIEEHVQIGSQFSQRGHGTCSSHDTKGSPEEGQVEPWVDVSPERLALQVLIREKEVEISSLKLLAHTTQAMSESGPVCSTLQVPDTISYTSSLSEDWPGPADLNANNSSQDPLQKCNPPLGESPLTISSCPRDDQFMDSVSSGGRHGDEAEPTGSKRGGVLREAEARSQVGSLVRELSDPHMPVWIEGEQYPVQYLVRQTRSMSARLCGASSKLASARQLFLKGICRFIEEDEFDLPDRDYLRLKQDKVLCSDSVVPGEIASIQREIMYQHARRDYKHARREYQHGKRDYQHARRDYQHTNRDH